MKEIERRLVSELMKNSRRSDRELARVLGISQPTVSRTMSKLEKRGVIREYTAIPDFVQLGYTLLAITFVRLKRNLTQDELKKARESAKTEIEGNLNFIMLERGMGMRYDGVFISLHEDYASFTRHTEWLRRFDFVEVSETQSFIVDLKDELHYRSLTLSTLAKHMLALHV